MLSRCIEGIILIIGTVTLLQLATRTTYWLYFLIYFSASVVSARASCAIDS